MRAVYVIFALLALSALALLASGCGRGQLSATCVPTASTSLEAPPHTHTWCVGAIYTKEYCNIQKECHNHKINENQNLAEAAGIGPHTHKLT
jgi:hypothetical protein